MAAILLSREEGGMPYSLVRYEFERVRCKSRESGEWCIFLPGSERETGVPCKKSHSRHDKLIPNCELSANSELTPNYEPIANGAREQGGWR